MTEILDSIELYEEPFRVKFNNFKADITAKDSKHGQLTDREILKFLVAHCWDIEVAKKYFLDSVIWKQNSYLAYLMDLPDEGLEVEKYYELGRFCGFSKEGLPVFYTILSRLDVEGVGKTVPYLGLAHKRMKYLKETMKITEEASKRIGKKVDQVVAIVDFKDFKLASILGDFQAYDSEMTLQISNNYPEVLSKIFLLNAGQVASKIFNLVTSFMSERFKSKIHVLGNNPEVELLKYIEKDQLPKCYGGLLEVPPGDAECRGVLFYNKKIDPNDYYGNVFKDYPKKDFEEVNVSKREELMIGTGKPGSLLKWVIISKKGCIGFGLKLKRPDDSEYDILKPIRINADRVPEVGSFQIKEAGRYYLILENSYSYFRNKTVYISVSLR